jgi:hypothetical protein
MLFDTFTVDATRITSDGYLAADARVARTGIQVYTGREIDPDNEHGLRDRAQVRVYRPADSVFSREAMTSYAHRPITNDHPSGAVDATNWRQLAVGMTGGEVVRDGEFVRVPLVLMDADTIAAVKSGKNQLSMGYTVKLSFDAGTTPEGEAYDATQTEMRMNHLALCRAARGGDKLKIGDQTKESGHMTTRTIIVDGLPVEVTDKDAAIVSRAIDSVSKARDAAEKALADATIEHGKVVAARDAELAKKDAEIATLKSQVVDAASLDKLVADRSALVSKVKAIVPTLDASGKSAAELRKAAVAHVRGADAIAGKSEAYVEAAFDLLADADPVRSAVSHGSSTPVPLGDARGDAAAYDKSIADLNSWRKKG